jgi:hypothetical protein
MLSKQRYQCQKCAHNFTEGDKRVKYDATKKNLVVRMYLNNCGFRRIAEILELPFSTVFKWIKNAGKIVETMIAERKDSETEIEILEMDELYTYIKKNRERIKKPEKGLENIPEFGLLWIGTDLKLLRLR